MLFVVWSIFEISKQTSKNLGRHTHRHHHSYVLTKLPQNQQRMNHDEMAVTRLTVMDAFNKTSSFKKEPEIGFGTGSRPPLMVPTSTPGPGAYQIKSTLSKTVDSTIKSPEQYTIRSRHTFGNPNLKALSKTTANEPGNLYLLCDV
jgi:hypothetical protein